MAPATKSCAHIWRFLRQPLGRASSSNIGWVSTDVFFCEHCLAYAEVDRVDDTAKHIATRVYDEATVLEVTHGAT